MTVSLPMPTTTPAAPGGKSAAAPGKGVAHAHGLSGAPAKPGATGDEAASVADMFAALVATLTAEMQPAVDGQADGKAAEVPLAEVPVAEVTTQDLTTIAVPVAPVVAVPVPGTPVAPVVEAVVAPTTVAATPTIDPAVAVAEADVPIMDGADTGATAEDGEQPGLGSDRRATPAVPATPATHDEAGTTPAQRATPAQPSVQSANAATTPTPAPVAPATAEESDPAVTPVSTAPAARAERPDAAARMAAPAAPVRTADAHVQVARVVRPLRLGDDGAYELALDLTPAELGRVRIDVELRGSTISLSLRADNPATRELLQQSMGQLRSELEAAGLHAGQLDVGGRGSEGHGTPGRDNGSDQSAQVDDLMFVVPTETDLTDLDASAGLDVRA